LRVLYCSAEYHGNHGGRTHAREFVTAFRGLPGVEAIEVFPQATVENSRRWERLGRNRLGWMPLNWQRTVRMVQVDSARRRRLLERIRAGSFEAVILRMGLNLLEAGAIARRAGDVILCLEVNASPFDESLRGVPLQTLWRKVEIRQYRRAELLTVVSGCLKDRLCRRGVPGSKIVVNPNGVNPEVFSRRSARGTIELRKELRIRGEAFVLGYVGGMEKFRRLGEVVECVGRLRRQGDRNLMLILVGDGPDMPAVRRTAEKQGGLTDGWVRCTGWRDYEKIPRIMETFDLAVFPFSNPYGSPQKLFEYLAMGVATIGPDVPAVRETFRDGLHLRLARQDGSDLGSLIRRLKNSPVQRRQLAREGRREVLARFTWRANARRVFDRLDAAIERRRARLQYDARAARCPR